MFVGNLLRGVRRNALGSVTLIKDCADNSGRPFPLNTKVPGAKQRSHRNIPKTQFMIKARRKLGHPRSSFCGRAERLLDASREISRASLRGSKCNVQDIQNFRIPLGPTIRHAIDQWQGKSVRIASAYQSEVDTWWGGASSTQGCVPQAYTCLT